MKKYIVYFREKESTERWSSFITVECYNEKVAMSIVLPALKIYMPYIEFKIEPSL